MVITNKIDRDQCLWYKRGVKYYTTRFYHAHLDIHPKETVYISYTAYDMNDREVRLPLVKLTPDGELDIYPRYAWDGASGPTWDSLSSMIGSLLHDVIYQLIRLGLIDPSYKEYGDEVLRKCCVEDGMYEWRADYWKFAVLKFGKGSTKPSAEPQEMVAPSQLCLYLRVGSL